MQAKAKSNSVVTSIVRPDGVIEVTVLKAKANGANAVLTLDPKKVSEACKVYAMNMGFVSRIVDAAAIPFDKKTNRYATPEEKLAAMEPIIAHLESGTEVWKLTRATVVKVAGLDPMQLAAVVEVTGREESEVREMVAKGAAKRGTSEAGYLMILANGERVKPIIARLMAEAAARSDIDGDDLLEEMMEPEAPAAPEGDEGEAPAHVG